ncbi:hypothetical protein M885DRAFT_623582 [Pelagophyceae sp. CCMP2097]|nr:hypothetical protein M885DRAFT_623582 [Pelagophyceae sp. CCMP2097]
MLRGLVQDAQKRLDEEDSFSKSFDKSDGAKASEEAPAKRPRRQCNAAPKPAPSAGLNQPHRRGPALTGRLLVVHANSKPYGAGAGGTKASNREFAFKSEDYLAMRDSGVYSGNPAKNKLLPLPRPTYTEFVNRAKKAKCLDRLDFVYCAPDATSLPRLDYKAYQRVVYAGVSFRRFARVWTPERHPFFSRDFQDRALCFACCASRVKRVRSLPDECLYSIIAFAASKADIRDGYDDLEVVHSGARHLFLPAPGSAGIREAHFDAVFGL